jgi:aspartate carbamoyltransferase catalytic subunit
MPHDLISLRDLSKSDIERYLKLAAKMEKNLYKSQSLLKGRILGTLFFEASTRTHLSFQTAAKRLGMEVVVFNPETSSASKGESLSDTIKIIDGYADVIVIRHAAEGSARHAADVAEHPVINGGDGGNQHPTQTLIDLYTILKEKKKISGLNVHLVGDLKHARAMRSLLYGLAMFGANVTLASPKGLEMDSDIIEEVKSRFGPHLRIRQDIALADADVVYVCRVQKERFADPYEAQKVQAQFRITAKMLEGAKKGMILLHPLPKVDEIPPEIDSSPHARYFQQAKNGVPVRMAVLCDCLGKK